MFTHSTIFTHVKQHNHFKIAQSNFAYKKIYNVHIDKSIYHVKELSMRRMRVCFFVVACLYIFELAKEMTEKFLHKLFSLSSLVHTLRG